MQNDNLFAILNNNDNIVLKNYNLADKTHKETLSIKENLAQIKTKSEYFEEFLKEARKSKMKPTITLNKNKNSNYIVRLDYVDKTKYQYSYNWWFLHWMWHQQLMMHQVNHNFSIGPNPDFYDNPYFNYVSLIKTESKSIEFVLDITTNNILENADLDTFFSNVDKEEKLEKFKDDKNMNEITAGFIESEMRYMYQDKKSKIIYIKYNKI